MEVWSTLLLACQQFMTTNSLCSVRNYLLLILIVAILILIYSAYGAYSLIIPALFADKQLVVTLSPALLIPFMLFAGYFVN